MVYHQKDSLAQNFIKYPRLVKELLDSADLNNSDFVLEIGPGKGIITTQLAKIVGRVVAVEVDDKLASDLKLKYNREYNIKIIHQDFLDYELPKEPYKVFSNIPFSKTSEILSKFLEAELMPESMYLIMQKETAEKFAGLPHETQSSILTKPFFEIEILGEIDRTNFLFKPQVHIVFVKFTKRSLFYIKEENRAEFRKFVIYGFNQWKMTLSEAFKKVFTYVQRKRLEKSLKFGGLKPSEVSFDTWLILFKSYLKITTAEQKKIL